MRLKNMIKGFSVVELLIAVIILGVLVAIIVPRLATRTELARKKSALVDLENLQNAEERAAVDTGYFYRLYVLDDTSGGDGYGFGDTDDIIDGVRDEQYTSYYSNNTQIFIDVTTGEFKTNYTYLYNLLAKNETAFGWNGPYINWNRDLVNSDGQPEPSRPNNADDIPDDPWGHNYLLFTPQGLIDEPEGQFVTTFMGSDTTVFDRMTLLSLGPNGLPGDGTPGAKFGTGDDLLRQF
ncbi:prepilin-type N-terminal cleavage/methylation domain-containing protein [Candidatus Sumerlaeota bacterium]|nr:prepilin-type N-terminal cleavage/methylation domain-containing protein [Candidatus Sumerlaeota bacterium]